MRVKVRVKGWSEGESVRVGVSGLDGLTCCCLSLRVRSSLIRPMTRL